jgi:hypothetical protein
VVSVIIGGVIAGIVSFLEGVGGEFSCEIPGICMNVISNAEEVLLPTQVLIFVTALLGTVFARSAGQLGRAVILGLAGPILALAVYGHMIGPAGVPFP